MSSGASDQDYNIWSVVASVLGILGLVPVLWDLFKSQLPLAKLRELEASLQETKEMLDDGVEQGLLHPEEFRLLMKATKAYIDDLKGHIYAATSLTEQFRDWRNGLCAKMDTVLREIHRTRATVAKNSSDKRKELALSGKTDMEFRAPCEKTDGAELALPVVEKAPPESTSMAGSLNKPQVSLSDNASPSPATNSSSSCPTACACSPSVNVPTPCATPTYNAAHSRVEILLSTSCPPPSLLDAPPGLEKDAAIQSQSLSTLDREGTRRIWKKRPPSRRDVLVRFGRQLMKPSPIHLHGISSDVLPFATPSRPARKKDLLRTCTRGGDTCPPGTRCVAIHIALPSSRKGIDDSYDGDDESDF